MDGGVFGRIVSGRGVIESLGTGDSITGIAPVERWETIVNKIVTADLSTVIEPGMRIFTYATIELSPDAPYGAEHFLAAAKDGVLAFRTEKSWHNNSQVERCRTRAYIHIKT
jgi:UPF0288 family protein (methanogenesis marker protein 3)